MDAFPAPHHSRARRTQRLRAKTPLKAMLMGGEPLGWPPPRGGTSSPAPRNIEQAKDDWQNGRFGTIPGDDKEFIPLPG